jgi:hypothetical protein
MGASDPEGLTMINEDEYEDLGLTSSLLKKKFFKQSNLSYAPYRREQAVANLQANVKMLDSLLASESISSTAFERMKTQLTERFEEMLLRDQSMEAGSKC